MLVSMMGPDEHAKCKQTAMMGRDESTPCVSMLPNDNLYRRRANDVSQRFVLQRPGAVHHMLITRKSNNSLKIFIVANVHFLSP